MTASVYTQSEACERCNNLRDGGYTDWELPDLYQLETLVDSRYSPMIDGNYFKNTKRDFYWTGSASNEKYFSWMVNFDNNAWTLADSMYMKKYARCVRIENPTPEGPLKLDTVLASESQAQTAYLPEISGFTPLSVNFAAFASGGAYVYYPSPYSFSWEMGYFDLHKSGQKINEFVFRHPGIFTVTCSVKDENNNIKAKSIKVSVASPTLPNLLADPVKDTLELYYQGGDGIDGPYIINGDTVEDQGTGLVWQRSDDGKKIYVDRGMSLLSKFGRRRL